jgi:Cation/multidrug efflux pump
LFSNFFINRPIFASVLSIMVTLAGSIALFSLPIAQYPEITPPTVEVSASYPGRQCQGRRGYRCRADRAAGQRRRKHAVHVVAMHQ